VIGYDRLREVGRSSAAVDPPAIGAFRAARLFAAVGTGIDVHGPHG
jgi:hypothetical protein